MLEGFFHRAFNWMQRRNANYNLRRRLAMLGAVGKNSVISPETVFKGNLKNVHIGSNVRISGEVIIDCDSDNSSIHIGDNSLLIGPSQLLTYGGFIKLGHDCSVNPFCTVYGHGGLTIGNFVRIATQTVIIPANHVFSNPDVPITRQGLTKKGITINDDVWIGAGVRILDGTVIGSGSVVGSSAVVSGEFDPYSIIVGIPAKTVKRRGN